MSELSEHNIGFLAHLGVSAEVVIDPDGSMIIVIETTQYEKRRGIIDTWYTLVRQTQSHSYFRERQRGTGITI